MGGESASLNNSIPLPSNDIFTCKNERNQIRNNKHIKGEKNAKCKTCTNQNFLKNIWHGF